MSPLANVDPDWAWSTFYGSSETAWDLRSAAHLFRRAGFSATLEQLELAATKSPATVVDDLLAVDREPESFRQEVGDLVRAVLGTGNVDQLAAQWAYRMLYTPVPLLEKMTLFWHGHFATSADKVDDVELMLEQNELLRTHALGEFGTLLLEISRDPAMLIYLDSASNRKAHPNENYAREIMELFCLGEGNYSEDDIRELARCFTGWEIKRQKFRFNRYQHDTGSKTVLGQSGNFGGEDGVRIVAEQSAAPRFLAMKLFHFLICDEPAAPPELLEPLADELRANRLQIGPTVKRMLQSNLMFSSHARARKVRSPVELGIGFLRSLSGSTDMYRLAQSLRNLGQGLFFPPSVKGWDGGRTWINSSTLLGRSNLIRQLVEHEKTRFNRFALEEYLDHQSVRSADDLIDFFQTVLFATDISAPARAQVGELFRTGKDHKQRIRETVQMLCTLPEFQLA